MYKLEDMPNLDKLPDVNQISLQLLQDFYENYVIGYLYKYKLKGDIELNIRFYREDFCHLLGIHKVVPQNMKGRYVGKNGYEKIKSGELTIANLKSMNEKEFNNIKLRMSAFFFVYKLMRDADIVKFFNKRVKGNCNLRSEFILYDEQSGYKLHLGVLKEQPDKDKYSPETYIVKRCSKKDKNYYTDGQQYMSIISREIIPIEIEKAV